MIKMKRIFTVLSLAILLLFSQVLSPIPSIGVVKEDGEINTAKLFQTTEQVELDEGIIINKDTYLYGEIQEEVISFQYADTFAVIPLQIVREVSEDESTPTFHDSFAQENSKQFSKDFLLYSLEPNENPRLVINEDLTYPISENELGMEVFYLGNIEFYLSEEDRIVAFENLVSDNTGEEENNDNVKEEEDEGLEEEAKDPEEDLGSNDPIEDTYPSEEQTLDEDNQHGEADTTDEVKENISQESFTTSSAMQSTATRTVDPWKGVSTNYFKVTKDNLVVYDNRSGSLKPIGKLEKNQVYPRVSDYGNWHRIQYGNIYGYVRKADTVPDNGLSLKNKNSSYKNQSRSFKALKNVVVYDNTSGKLVPYGIIDKGQSYPIATDYGNWWRVIFADRIGYVRKSDVESEFIKSDKYFRAEGNIVIYDNRSGSLKKVGELKKGQIYPRVSDYGNWHRIQFGNFYGYVRKSETSVALGSSIKNMNNNYKNQSRTFTALQTATVYDNTSGKLVPFGTIDKGTTFPIATDYGNWWRVIYADRVGYVRKDEVRATSSSTDKYFRVTQNTEVFDNRTGKLIKVGEINKGETYPIVSNYGNWWRVQFGDIYGYVRKSHTGYATGKEIKNLNGKYKNSNNKFIANQKVTIYDNSSGNLVPFGTLEKGTVYPIATDYGNWWRIIYLDRVGYVRKTEVDLYGVSYTNYNLTLNQAVDIQKDPERNPKVWASHAFVYKGYIDKNNRVTANSLNVRNKPNSSDKDSKVIDKLAKGTKVEILGEMNNWYAIKTDKVQEVTALPDQIRYYLDPKNFMNDPKQKFQFLVLSKPSGASVTMLNNYLKGKGSLSGQGSAFYNAARNHGINDVYLLSHAIHETGHGSSTLANGVEVGINNKGDLEVVTAQNRSQLTAIKKTYNMFGIGAVDTNPLHGGAKTAYANGWFTPALAIDGGAKWISNGYIQNRFKQDTLYKMKWNPQMKDGNAWKQYATDVAWASKQVNAIYNLYQELGITDSLEFDYPSYN